MVNELPNQCSAPRELSPRGAGAERGPRQERCRLRWNLPRNHPRCQRQPQSSATEGPCPPVPPRCLFPLVPAHGRGEGAGLSSAADTRLLTSNREYLSASASATSGAETTLQSRWSAPRRERSSRPGRPALRPAPRKTPASQSPRGEGGPCPAHHPSGSPGGQPRRGPAAPGTREPTTRGSRGKQLGKVAECFGSKTPPEEERRLVRNAVPRASQIHWFPTFLFIGNDPFDTFT